MIAIKSTISHWLSTVTPREITKVANYRLGNSSIAFLKERKLVTSTFNTPFFFIDRFTVKNEVLRFFKIILINLRKKLPILKLGDAVYRAPFVTIRTRLFSLDILLSRSSASVGIIHRYLRRIGVYRFISEKKIPLRIDIYDDVSRTSSSLPAIDVLNIRIEQSQGVSAGALPLFIPIFYIPTLIRIISTLHRKACFLNDNRATAAYSSAEPSSLDT